MPTAITATATVGVGGTSPAITYTTYDGKGQLLSQTDSANDTTSSTYSAAGFVLTTTDARGVETSYVHNGAGQQIEVVVSTG